MNISAELIIAISSMLGGFAAIVGAIFTYLSDKNKTKIEERNSRMDEEKFEQELADQVMSDTVGLYTHLRDQFNATTKKDRDTLRGVAMVIRKLIMLERTVNETIVEMEKMWGEHKSEALQIGCPFYNQLTAYYSKRIRLLDSIISGTMEEVDRILLNGTAKKEDK